MPYVLCRDEDEDRTRDGLASSPFSSAFFGLAPGLWFARSPKETRPRADLSDNVHQPGLFEILIDDPPPDPRDADAHWPWQPPVTPTGDLSFDLQLFATHSIAFITANQQLANELAPDSIDVRPVANDNHPVPEPGTVLLLATGLLAAAHAVRRRRAVHYRLPKNRTT